MNERWQRMVDRATSTCGVLHLRELTAIGWTRDEVRHRVRRGEWLRLLPGVLLVDPAQVCGWSGWSELLLSTRVAAALAYHGGESVFVGLTAARLLKIEGLPGDDGIVHLRLPPGRERHQQAGIRLHTTLLAHGETTKVAAVTATSVARTVTDLALTLPRDDAVSVFDAVLGGGLMTREQMDGLRSAARGRRGVRRSSSWWRLADGRAQSPLETRIRLIAVDAGLPPDELQYPVIDRNGVLLGYGDMAWHLGGGRVLIAEADGRGPHEQPGALFRDRRRANDFLGTGRVDMIRFTWADALVRSYVTGTLRRQLRARDLDQKGIGYGMS